MGRSWTQAGGQIVPDPDIQFGRYKVLRRTDGAYAVFDTQAPIFKGTVALFKSLDGATRRAKKLHEEEDKAKPR